MANSGANTNNSQFFITYEKQETLDGNYTVFGHVIGGLDTLDALENSHVDKNYKPLQDISIKHVTLHANPIADQTK